MFPAEAVPRQLGSLIAGVPAHLEQQAPAWWMHIDLDVLRGNQFAACAAATEEAMPGGLTWTELASIVRPALRSPRCRGLSVGVYNTDLDPDRRAGRNLVRFLADVTGAPAP